MKPRLRWHQSSLLSGSTGILGQMGESKRHHLVSRAYLRAWCPEGETELVNARILPSVDSKLIGTAHICVKPDWHAMARPDGSLDRSIELDLAANVEGPGLTAVRKLTRDGAVAPEARFEVALFLASLAVRGTEVRQQIISAGLEVGEQYLSENPGAAEGVRWEQGFHANGTRGLEVLFSLLFTVQTSILMSMHWRVLRATDARFATSDQPLAFYNRKEHRTTGSPLTPGEVDAVFVALSPTALLVGSWRRGADYGVCAAPAGLAGWFNGALLAQADVHFIEPPGGCSTTDPRDPLPELGLTTDKERLERTWRCVRYTADERHDGSIAFIRWDRGRYFAFRAGDLSPAA